MFSTSSIIDNLSQEEGLEYKKLCRLLKISKKSDKEKLDIALFALEKLEIINKNKDNEFSNVKDSKHLVAKIRCSSKGYCFAVRENNKEDIYIKENLLNHAWNGDKVLVRIIKEGYRRKSPEGIVDCILERSNQILLAKVEVINDIVYAIPIDDRILSKVKLPIKDEIYKYDPDNKNIVKVAIDLFPIGQEEGLGHVIQELKLNNDEKQDTEFVLSKSNIKKYIKTNDDKSKDISNEKRIDLTDKCSYMFKSWDSSNSPLLPLVHVEQSNDKDTKLWLHATAISERLDLSSKKALETFSDGYESFPLIETWQNYLSEKIIKESQFNIDEPKEALSICINLNNDNEIINWSFHLTLVKCSLVLDSKHLEALLKRKSKTRITSKLLQPIKEHVVNLDKISEISADLRKNQVSNGKIEITKYPYTLDSLEEFFIHNPTNHEKEFLEPLSNYDCQTYLSPIVYEANLLWFKHSIKLNLKSAAYISQDLDSINVSEIVKYSELIGSNVELNVDGTLTFKQLIELCDDDNKKKILQKLLINELKDNNLILISENTNIDESKNSYLAPWTMPAYDFTNLINQHNIHNMIVNGKKTNKNNNSIINISEKDSLQKVNWDIYSASTSKNIDLLFNNIMIEKLIDYKNKAKQYRSNMISIKQVRKAEKLIGKSYEGFIISVQSYGFFVEIPDLNVEGLVHVSTLSNDWYEYRSRQNLLIGRKSKKSYKIGDKAEIKIVKVDILKYQIDLELK